MCSTKQNVAVVQVKYGSRRSRVSSMAILVLTCGPITSHTPKNHNHIGASCLKKNSMAHLCSIVLDCIEIIIEKKEKKNILSEAMIH